jgi:hypothetical protein
MLRKSVILFAEKMANILENWGTYENKNLGIVS